MITYHIASNKLFNYQISKLDAGYFKFFQQFIVFESHLFNLGLKGLRFILNIM